MIAPVDARRDSDQLGESGAECTERIESNLETDVGDAEISTPQQRHGTLDAPGHQIGVRGFTVCSLKFPTEVAGRHVCSRGKIIHSQGVGELPVDAVTDFPEPNDVAEVVITGVVGGHDMILAENRGRCPVIFRE